MKGSVGDGGAGSEMTRLEIFSDAVLAIILTIMVLELKAPHGVDPDTLEPLLPVFLSYVLSFVYIGIYWGNHHHLMRFSRRMTGAVLWANLHLLFWLSLFPFVTSWMGQNHFAPLPTAVYGMVLFAASSAYELLQYTIIVAEGRDSPLALAVGRDWKGKVSTVAYLFGIAATFYQVWIGQLVLVVVAATWLLPDRRLERMIAGNPPAAPRPARLRPIARRVVILRLRRWTGDALVMGDEGLEPTELA